MDRIRIERVITPQQFTQAALLLGEYRGWIETNFEVDMTEVQPASREEFWSLDTYYAAPNGRLLLATVDGEPAGIAGFRRIDDTRVEGKRMYVRRSARGRGVGRRLLCAVLDLARESGYTTFYGETHPEGMPEAQHLYRWAGFRSAPAETLDHVDGIVGIQIDLRSDAAPEALAA